MFWRLQLCDCLYVRRLWFLPLRQFNEQNDQWFIKFLRNLMDNNETVCSLLAYNPFEHCDIRRTPINAIRVLKYEYRFPNDENDDQFGATALNITDENKLQWEYGAYWMRRHLYTLYIPTITRKPRNESIDVINNRHPSVV